MKPKTGVPSLCIDLICMDAGVPYGEMLNDCTISGNYQAVERYSESRGWADSAQGYAWVRPGTLQISGSGKEL